ncbi:MAG: PIN domain protein [Planctomycetes bacterium]|nr:PIN domain protein [Planctomycetota bacterium]
MKPRIYTDTSVLGGCEDEEFRTPSRRLLRAFVEGELVLVLSELVVRELESAPEAVRQSLAGVPEENMELVAISPEVEALASAYLEQGAVPPSMRADALHIAFATLARVDVLVSWNFKHIVNLHRIHAFNAVNLKRGLPLLEIRTPREVIGDE